MLNDIPSSDSVDKQSDVDKTEAIKNVLLSAKETPEEGAVPTGQMDLSDVDLTDTSVEQEAYDNTMRSAGVAAPDPPEKSDLPHNTVYDEDAFDTSNLDALDNFSASYSFADVTVDPEEKDRFLRSSLNDTSLYFDVEIPGIDAIVRVYMPSTKEHTAIVDAATLSMDIEVIQQPNKWLLLLQRLYMHVQIDSIDERKFSTYDREISMTTKELVNYLGEPDTMAYVVDMQTSRYNLLVLAMKIAERKMKLCNDGLMDSSFFVTASTD